MDKPENPCHYDQTTKCIIDPTQLIMILNNELVTQVCKNCISMQHLQVRKQELTTRLAREAWLHEGEVLMRQHRNAEREDAHQFYLTKREEYISAKEERADRLAWRKLKSNIIREFNTKVDEIPKYLEFVRDALKTVDKMQDTLDMKYLELLKLMDELRNKPQEGKQGDTQTD